MKPRTEIPWRIKLRLMLESSVVGRHLGTLIAIGVPPVMMAAAPVFLMPILGRNAAIAFVGATLLGSVIYLGSGKRPQR